MNKDLMSFADQLIGVQLINGWVATEKISRPPGATGGAFSKAYVVTNEHGHRAFCKAIDITKAFQEKEVFRAQERILRAYRYERDLVQFCANSKMDRVVTVLDSGEVLVDPANAFSLVPYLVFEMATGDVHSFLDFSGRIDLAFIMRTLHEVSVALVQLHQKTIAHQDVKPSNVVVFEVGGAKLGDLGRASVQGSVIDHDFVAFAGDRKYTPPELLYGVGSADWVTRRLGCDAYMFGALAFFLLTGLCISVEIQDSLDPSLRSGAFRGKYEDLLPYLRQVTNELILKAEGQVPVEIRQEVVRMIRELCDPDPLQRGHPAQRRQKYGNPYDLMRYTTLLDRLRKRSQALLIAPVVHP